MKFTIDRNSMIHEITIASDVIGSSPAFSSLSNVSIETTENSEVIISATSTVMGFKSHIPADIAVEGTTKIVCDKLLNILRSSPEGEIEFETLDNFTFIRPKTRTVDFKLNHISEYSDVVDTGNNSLIPNGETFEIPQKEFAHMIDQTIFAISNDETRTYMNGLFIKSDVDNSTLRMVSTDGKRLSIISKKIEGKLQKIDGVIVPQRIFQITRRLLSKEGMILLSVDETGIYIRIANQWISSALITGSFPDYERVIPENQDYSIIIEKKILLEALKRTAIFEDSSKRVHIRLRNNEMTILSKEKDTGEAEEKISCKYEGEEIILAVNHQFIEQPVRAMDSDSVAVLFTNNTRALTIQPEVEMDFFHVVMPMQVDSTFQSP